MQLSSLKRALAILISVSATMFVARVEAQAQAQTSEPPPRGSSPPAAHKGFQLAIRPNLAVPLGSAFEDADLSLLTTALVGVDVEVGWKPIPNLFLGGRPSIGVGGVGDARDLICDAPGATCVVVRAGLGAEAQYQFKPGERWNPWVGYGFGLDVLSLNRDSVLGRLRSSFYGFDFARLTGGMDWRITRGFGIGLFVDFAMGIYFREALTVENERTRSEAIDNTAMHYWLTLGPRFVLFP